MIYLDLQLFSTRLKNHGIMIRWKYRTRVNNNTKIQSKVYLTTKTIIYNKWEERQTLMSVFKLNFDKAIICKDNIKENQLIKEEEKELNLNDIKVLPKGDELIKLKHSWLNEITHQSKLSIKQYLQFFFIFQHDLKRQKIIQLQRLINYYLPNTYNDNERLFWYLIHKQLNNEYIYSILLSNNNIEIQFYFILLNVLLNQNNINKTLLFNIENRISNILNIKYFHELPFSIKNHYFMLLSSNHPIYIIEIFNRWFPKHNLKELELLLNNFFKLKYNNRLIEYIDINIEYITNQIQIIINEMLDNQLHLSNNTIPDTKLCDLLLDYFILEEYYDAIEPWIIHLIKFNRSPTSLFICKAINILKKSGNYGLAYRLFLLISNNHLNYKFNPLVYLSTLDNLIESKQNHIMLSSLINHVNSQFIKSINNNSIEHLPIQIQISYYNTLLKYSFATRNTKSINMLLQEIQPNNQLKYFSIHTCNMLLREYANKKMFNQLERLLNDMINQHHFIPTSTVYFFIIRAYLNNNLKDKAYYHLHFMLNHLKLTPIKEIYDLFEEVEK